jgi:hypothetical protein
METNNQNMIYEIFSLERINADNDSKLHDIKNKLEGFLNENLFLNGNEFVQSIRFTPASICIIISVYRQHKILFDHDAIDKIVDFLGAERCRINITIREKHLNNNPHDEYIDMELVFPEK